MNAATALDRQHARDRAADAVAPHHAVVVGHDGWPDAPLGLGTDIHPSERARRYRARVRQLAAQR